MTKLELGIIISKVFALFYFLKALSNLSSTLYPFIFHNSTPLLDLHTWTLLAIYPFSFLLLSSIFWLGSGIIGKKIAGKDEQKSIGALKHEDLLVCVFVGFGCLLLYKTIPVITTPLSILFSDPETQKRYTYDNKMTKDMIESFLYFILSMFFIFGANGLQKTVSKIRDLGKELRDLGKE